jgi:hypothetical protein
METPEKSDFQSHQEGILKRVRVQWENMDSESMSADFESGGVIYINNCNSKSMANTVLNDAGLYTVAGLHLKTGVSLSNTLTIMLIPIVEAAGMLIPAPGYKVIACGLEVTCTTFSHPFSLRFVSLSGAFEPFL